MPIKLSTCSPACAWRAAGEAVVLVTVAIAAVVMIALDAIFGGILGLIIGA